MKWSRPLVGVFVFFSLCLIQSREAAAVPWFAVFGEARCSHCHVNPTGAGMRNDHGVMLTSEFPFEKTSRVGEDFKGRINRYFALGGDLRVQNLSNVRSPRDNSFTIPEGSLYVAVDPVSHLTLYVDTDLANTTNREAFGLVHKLPAGAWLKFGRLNLPYGLRLPDDTSFIRSDLGLTFLDQDIGIEIGAEPGPFTFAAGFTNGVGGGPGDDNSDKAVSWLSEWRRGPFRLGGSFLYNNAALSRVVSGGGHTGLHVWNLALLGEFDVQQVRNKTTGVERQVLAGYGEVDYRIVQGLVLKGTYDGIDDRLAASGLHHRIGGGFEVYPIRHLEVDLFYRARMGKGDLNDDQVVFQLHGYF